LKTVSDSAKTYASGPIALVSDHNVKTAITQYDYIDIEGDGIPTNAVDSAGKLTTTWGKIKTQY
jgi:hypothetical protein